MYQKAGRDRQLVDTLMSVSRGSAPLPRYQTPVRFSGPERRAENLVVCWMLDVSTAGTVWISTRDAWPGVRHTLCVCALKSFSVARKMFGTQVCGLRSMIGNHVLCTCTMIRCPLRKR